MLLSQPEAGCHSELLVLAHKLKMNTESAHSPIMPYPEF